MALNPGAPCAFVAGDRVVHRLYGTGVVTAPPSVVMVLSASAYKLVPDGWRLEVSWDNQKWAPCRIDSDQLTPLKPHPLRPANRIYKEQRRLLQTWRTALHAIDDYVLSCGPAQDAEMMRVLQHQEDDAWHSMRQYFLDDGRI